MTQTALAQEKTGMAGEVWNRLCRCSFTRRRISRKSLVRDVNGRADARRAFGELDHRRFFPNSFVVSKKKDSVADLHTDPYYHGLSEIGDESFGVVLCTRYFAATDQYAVRRFSARSTFR